MRLGRFSNCWDDRDCAGGMVSRHINLDEETDRLLADLAQDYKGDLSRALADLVYAHESLEAFVNDCFGTREKLTPSAFQELTQAV
jgi:hypothetical protein